MNMKTKKSLSKHLVNLIQVMQNPWYFPENLRIMFLSCTSYPYCNFNEKAL